MDESVYVDLERAVRSRSTLISAREIYKEKADEIKEKRKKLLMKATESIEGSPAMDQLHREIDLLDKEEFDLYRKFRKIIERTESDINRIIAGMLERRFGPNWSSDLAI
jgi:hypothetical protein